MGITVGKKKLENGRFSLFLDISLGGRRWKEYIGVKLEKPMNSVIRQENKDKMQMAQQLRLQRERQLLMPEFHLPTPDQRVRLMDFYDIFEAFISSYNCKDIKVVKASYSHLKKYAGKKTLPLMLINKEFCDGFFDYLSENLHGNTPAGYFKKFKMCLEQCVEQGLIATNPTRNIRLVQSDAVMKDILNVEEIQQLAKTQISNNEVKRAFLFACNCGLRWCDVRDLTYKSIDFQNNIITIKQQKVQYSSSKAVLHLNMNATTVNLLRMRSGAPDEHVFTLPSYSYARRILLAWTKKAGINKHITFHCARHSFITNIMINGANIKTAAALAGHSTIRHTEKYVHIIDDLKSKAVNSLPEILLEF